MHYDQHVFTVACILTYIVKGRQRQTCRENYNHAAYRWENYQAKTDLNPNPISYFVRIQTDYKHCFCSCCHCCCFFSKCIGIFHLYQLWAIQFDFVLLSYNDCINVVHLCFIYVLIKLACILPQHEHSMYPFNMEMRFMLIVYGLILSHLL